MIDYGKNKRNVALFVDAVEELKSIYTTAELDQKYEELQSLLVPKDEDLLSQPTPTTKESIASFLSFFVPREGYYITPILINLNIVVFVLMVMSGVGIMLPENENLIKWGANFKPVTLEGEWWRLLSCCFVHIGILHLLMNMYALLYVGLLIEPYLGKTRFAFAYLLTGIASSLVSLWWHDYTVSAGASGAIFGMYGLFLAMLSANIIEKSARKALLTSIGVFIVFNLMNGMKGGIDNAAHIGGLLSGLLVGYCYIPSLKKPEASQLKYSTIALIAVLILGTTVVVYGRLPNDIGTYQNRMNSFSVMEERALGVYKLPANTPTSTVLSQIKDSGMYYWGKNLELLKEADKLQVPETFHSRNRKLTAYCNLRIKSYELLYKTYNENTDKYKDTLDSCNNEIDQAINQLK